MPDRDYTIRIKTVADNAGAQQAQSGLDEVTKSTEKATNANEEHHKGLLHVETAGKAVHKVLHQLTEASPVLGVALRAAISPLTGLIWAVSTALQFLRRAFEENQKAAEDAATKATDSFSGFTDAVNRSRSAAEDTLKKFKEQFDEIRKAAESAQSAGDKIATSWNNQKEAILAVMKAKEQYELSQAGDEHARDQIRLRYASAQGAAGLAMERSMIAAKEQNLAAAQARAPELQQALRQAEAALVSPDAERRLHGLSILEGDIDTSKGHLQEANLKLRKEQAKWWPSPKRIQEAQAEVDRMQAHLGFQTTERESILGDIASDQAKADRARRAVLDNQNFIQKNASEIPELQSAARLHLATYNVEQSYARAGAAQDEGRFLTGNMFGALRMGDLGTALQNLGDVAILPVKVAQLTQAIKAANAQLEEALREQNRHNDALRGQIRGSINP